MKSEEILGLWNFSPSPFHRALSPDIARSILSKAWEKGIRYFDSAYSYENADTILYSFFSRRKIEREEYRVISKVMPVETMQKKVENTLKRIKSDYLDILLLHWPTDEKELFKSLKKLEDIKKEEKAKEIGVSNFPLFLLTKATKDFEISFHERPLSLCWNKDYEEERRTGIKILSYAPLASGFLSKKEEREAHFFFENSPYKEELFNLLEKYSNKYNTSLSSISYSWVLQKNPFGIIRGVSKKEQLDIKEIELDNEEIKELDLISSKITALSPSDNIFSHNYKGEK